MKESDESKTLHIHIDFRKGGEFVNDAGEKQKAYETDDKTWRTSTFSTMSAISIAVCRAL